jgi:hypothetical protein
MQVWIDIMIKQAAEFMEVNILEKRHYLRLLSVVKAIRLLKLKKMRVILLLRII